MLYYIARALIALIQSLPLTAIARFGRCVGTIAYWLDARHRRVALQNLEMCFGREMSAAEIRALAKENFRRIGESTFSAIKTAAMSKEELLPHVEFVGVERLLPPRRMVFAIGHFGNFELHARFHQFTPGYQSATTYRALKNTAMNRLMQSLRKKSGCLFFERRTDGKLLRAAMHHSNLILGLLADQSTAGLRAPFLGHDCSTTLSPAIFALRYDCELFTGFCFRVGLAKWRLELGEQIATHENGVARSSEDIMREVNRSFEAAVRRDPANWFWVHRRWKSDGNEAKAEASG
jgi:KDO2-lipid IV(A) lauroyltransferase